MCGVGVAAATTHTYFCCYMGVTNQVIRIATVYQTSYSFYLQGSFAASTNGGQVSVRAEIFSDTR